MQNSGNKHQRKKKKDLLTLKDIKAGVTTFGAAQGPRKALETPEGKNNGALPQAYEDQQPYHP
ncbi:hypothetical protein LLH06_11985 [Mucilaginibacter daejeonensis]|uniref:hypothetical protein n=1 Tax=Mucilaginibacter daejeonensis TaxID=398049 RepID=UPI001D1738BB|nr:hypothetical protein [Mucilaginibacter daejeonensis]UEG51689.1 hypothetical protein LLH06_11985 [Mucilaginibacter daejeonensis]